MINRAEHFIIQNSIQKRRLIEYYEILEDKISIIPTGFDDIIVEDVKNQPIPEHSGNIIMFSGRLSKYKGVFELINAFTEISRANSNWNLWLIGDGPDRLSLETLVRSRGLSDRVKFLGLQNMMDTIKYTNLCKIFVFPSYIESIPSSVLEAMALGKSIIVTNVGPIGIDLVDESCGVLIPPKNTKALKDGLLRLMSSDELRQKLGRLAVKKVENITKEKMVEKTIEVYQKVL
ncbi:MAG: glycosyltransferase family 4 protein [Candidatus Hodarchaeota archaeon]